MSGNEQDMQVGANLVRLRLENGMTQDDLAQRMREHGYKWSKTTVWSIERGNRSLKLTEAQELLTCMGMDWTASLPALLTGKSISDVTAKLGVLSDRFDAISNNIEPLAEAYFQFLMAVAKTRNDSEPDKFDQLVSNADEYCPESLNSLYWDAIKSSIRRYCLERSEANGTTYNDEWSHVFDNLDEKLKKYTSPDLYYDSDDNGDD